MGSALDTKHGRTRRPERLSGELVVDHDGQVAEPGEANPVDPSVLVPTMLAKRELDYLHYLASDLSDRGRVVELGCFLGGSTAAIHAGVARGASVNRPILVYDGFCGPPVSAFEADPRLAHFGIEPDVSFRGHYERLHRAYLDQLVIREGLIPACSSQEELEGLYPEQEPIELLFVDVAKAWGVHVSVARAFLRHVVVGGVVVQQDIGDFRTPWIVVHMWQLRDCFEPMDRVRETPTIGFRCTADPGGWVAGIDPHPETPDCEQRERMWDEIGMYWSGVLGEGASGWLSGHRAVHALHCADSVRVIEHAERYEDWIRSSGSFRVYVSPEWSSFTGLIPGYLQAQGADAGIVERAETLTKASGLRDGMGSPTELFRLWTTDSMKELAWRRTAERLVAEDRTEVVLYGGGRHTRWLLESGILPDTVRVRCVLDDNPVSDEILGIPVCSAPEWLAAGDQRCVLLPSSDAYEATVVERAQRLAGDGLEIWRVYTDPVNASMTHDDAAEELADDELVLCETPAVGVDSASLAAAAPHRGELGLGLERDWVDTIVRRYARPSWTRGHISTADAAFLWDCVEASGAERIVEIGTASGMSTL
ncbi:MAG: hypothetical protein KC996_10190, partial [Phycisphaerales bacterium]|nr:hypothetical protein [Phycisphaerales bacterium]